MQGHQQRTAAQILSVIQTQRCIYHSQRDFLNLLMIRMPACLAHLKPNRAVMHLCALCTLALWSALHEDSPSPLPLLNDALHYSHRSSRR